MSGTTLLLRQRADRLHRKGHRCPSPPCPFEEEAALLRQAADEIENITIRADERRVMCDGNGPGSVWWSRYVCDCCPAVRLEEMFTYVTDLMELSDMELGLPDAAPTSGFEVYAEWGRQHMRTTR